MSKRKPKRVYKDRVSLEDVKRECAAQLLTLEEQLEASIADEKLKQRRGLRLVGEG